MPGLVVMQGNDRFNNAAMGPKAHALEALANDLVPMFNDLGVHMVDSERVQQVLQKEAAKVNDNDDLINVLKQANAADVVCQGLATAVNEDPALIPYTFKITDCNNGDLIGSTSWPADPRIVKQKGNKSLLAKPENRTRFIAGQMLLAIERKLGAGKVLSVEVRNAEDLTAVQKLADAIKGIDDVSAEGVRLDNGVGTFTIRYSGNYEDLSPRLSGVVEGLKPMKVVEANPSVLRVDAGKTK